LRPYGPYDSPSRLGLYLGPGAARVEDAPYAEAFLADALCKVNELENLLHLARSKVVYARRRLRVYHLHNLSTFVWRRAPPA